MSIDKLFKNKLENHQIEPSDQVWQRLEETLYGKQIKQRNLVAYWRVAAAVALILTVSFFYYQNESKQNQGLIGENFNKLQEKNVIISKPDQEIIHPEIRKSEIENTHLKESQSLVKQDGTTKKATRMTKVNQLGINYLPQKNAQQTTVDDPNKGIHQEMIVQNTTQNRVKEEVSSNASVSLVEEENFAIVIKVEEQEEQEVGTDKKSWLKKMVNNIRKNREKERAKEEEYEEKPEKSHVSIFGISADKIFAKKHKQDEQQKQNNE
jgi:hypothetical protein